MYRYNSVHGPRSTVLWLAMTVKEEPAADAMASTAAGASTGAEVPDEAASLMQHISIAPGILKLASSDVHAHCLCPECILQPFFTDRWFHFR